MPYDKGRNDSHRIANDEAKYRMRRGMARTAMEMKVGQDRSDAYGKPLSYAKRMAEGHSISTLEKWMKDKRVSYSLPPNLGSQYPTKGSSEVRRFRFDKKLGKLVRIDA